MPKIKKILTLEQLVNFCEKNKFYTFNSKDMGYTLSVQVPGYFEAESNSTKGLLFTKLRVCHTELNRNHSFISEENMKKAMPSLKYRPVLGKIHQLDDGTWDFHAHDMNFVEDENGEINVEYEEKQIGTFTADDPYLEYNEEYDKIYVMANAVIPMEYTKAAEIIERKNGTRVSCELCIESMSYNANEKRLELEDFYFSGTTCLGCEKDGTEIGEGMLGSRLDISDFSTENNGIFKEDSQSKMIEALDRLYITLSNFNIKGIQESKEKSKEGGKTVNKIEELLTKYSKAIDDITFEVEGLSDEELEVKFEELFGDTDTDNNDTDDTIVDTNDSTADTDDDTVVDVNNTDDVTTQTASEDDDNDDDKDDDIDYACGGKKKKCSIDENGMMSLSFEISHDDIRCALYNLIEQYDELDNDYYYIHSVYDNYFIMKSWCSDISYGCKYTKDGDNVTLDGERYRLFEEFLTESEKSELENIRSNYSSIEAELNTYKEKEVNAQKEELFSSDDYKGIFETEAFIELKKDCKNFTVEELTDKLDKIIAESVKKGTFSFNGQKEENKTVKRVNFAQTLVADKPKKNSFLDGLLNK